MIASVLGCGWGDEEEPPAEAAEQDVAATAPGEPAAPAGPFQAHSATLDVAGTELDELAHRTPGAFDLDDGLGRRPLDAAALTGAERRAVELQLTFLPADGVDGVPVYATLARLEDGRVRVTNLQAGPARNGAAAITPPPPIREAAQALRLAVMDGGCALPTASDEEVEALYPSSDPSNQYPRTYAFSVSDNCPAARDAFSATSLGLAEVRVVTLYTAPRRGIRGRLRYVKGTVRAGDTLAFERLLYGHES